MTIHNLDKLLDRVIADSIDLAGIRERYYSIIDSYRSRALHEVEKLREATLQRVEEEKGSLNTKYSRLLRTEEIRAREEVFQKALKLAQQLIEGLRGTEAYTRALERLLEEAVKAVGEPVVVVSTRSEDSKLLATIARRVSSRLGVEIRIGDPVDTVFGLVARSADGKVVYDCRFESRLRLALPRLRARVYRILFG
ncbi:V-type ATP synthase subunit E [Pyrodictium abyssi]|uniref:V-ATPase subunit E n=1 Tax=Pyrodictium abyssi TaxID=54256 RepID=A0ABM8IVT5_9CREN|nr:hypothetical protein PABY_12260 [Pyrodictium abyssi]